MFSATIFWWKLAHNYNRNFNLLVEAMFSATNCPWLRSSAGASISIFLLKLCSLLHFWIPIYNRMGICISIFLLKLCSLLLLLFILLLSYYLNFNLLVEAMFSATIWDLPFEFQPHIFISIFLLKLCSLLHDLKVFS